MMPPAPNCCTPSPRLRDLLLGALSMAALPLAAAVLSPAPVRAQAIDPKPFPVIEAGMHTAIIKRVGVDRAGRWAVTASDDKTARVWELATGKQVEVLRVPVGEGDEGKLYAAAMSPDGALIALGGKTSPEGTAENLYVFDRASSRMLQRLSGLPAVIHHLAFSADGRWLAAALGGGNGIRIYGREGVGRWQLVAADTAYGDHSYRVEFDGTGRLVATSWDGELRLYSPPPYRGAMTPIQRRAVPGGKLPYFARFSPDGSRIAVGFDDTMAVQILDGRSLSPLEAADTTGIDNGNLSKVAWSVDGRHLLAAGNYAVNLSYRPLLVWTTTSEPPRKVDLGFGDVVMDLRPLADGRLVYGGAGPAWGILDRDFHREVFRGQPVLDTRRNLRMVLGKKRISSELTKGGQNKLYVSQDGRWLKFIGRSWSSSGQRQTFDEVYFDLTRRKLSGSPPPSAAGALAPRTEGLPILGWLDTTHPTLRGRPLPLKPYEFSRSLAISTDGRRFALGSDWGLQFFDQAGKQLWRAPVPGGSWLVNLSPDGRFVLAGLGDGTIRWYRTTDGREALALFVHPDRRRWVLWTPEGFFDASPATASSPGGAALLGYHLNQSRDAAGTFVSSAQLERPYFRPDLISRRLEGTPAAEAAITLAVARLGDVQNVLAAGLPPRVEPDRRDGEPVRYLPNGDVEIRFRVVDQGGGIDGIEIRLNGVQIEGRQNLRTGDRHAVIISPPPRQAGQASKPELTIAAANSRSVLGQPFRVELIPGAAAQGLPTLHVLAVGITDYRDKALHKGVRFAANDASALVDTLKRRYILADAALGAVVLIPDKQATRERIRQELEAMALKVKPGDRFVLYLAGHGMAIDGEYYFLTQEVEGRSEEAVRRQALSGSQLRQLLRNIPSSRGTLLLFDTCSSGTYNSSDQRDLKDSVKRFDQLDGRLMLAAAGDRRMALESPFGQSGIFTAVVIKGLLGDADTYGNDRIVRASELLGYVVNTVPVITEREFKVRQEPYASSEGDFPLSRRGAVGP